MRLLVLLSVAVTSVALDAMTLQAGKQGADGKPAPGACSILTRDLVMAHSPASKESLDVVMKVPPQEEKIGSNGSACQHGDVMLQINPFPVANFDAMFSRFTPVSDLGQKAYFRDNRGEWAELAVLTGGRVITLQMDVPRGKTAASIQANVVSLAKAVVAKLK
jgi:hypothetical protein